MLSAMSDDVLIHVENRIATLTLNRPGKLNALSADLLTKSIEALHAWSEDPNVAVVVVTGAGRAFCAGGDIGGMAKSNTEPQSLEQQVDRLRRVQQLSWLLYSIPKITIASINGFAMGAGLGVALACDLRIASDQAKFGTAYAKIAFGGDFGVTWLLTQSVGAARAKELMVLADTFDAQHAEKYGMLNRVVPHESLASETSALAQRIAQGPLVSFRYMKENVNMATTTDFRTVLEREAETHTRCGQTDDHKEGVKAFLEKRPPVFRGK